jgi:hypothetical protein
MFLKAQANELQQPDSLSQAVKPVRTYRLQCIRAGIATTSLPQLQQWQQPQCTWPKDSGSLICVTPWLAPKAPLLWGDKVVQQQSAAMLGELLQADVPKKAKKKSQVHRKQLLEAARQRQNKGNEVNMTKIDQNPRAGRGRFIIIIM